MELTRNIVERNGFKRLPPYTFVCERKIKGGKLSASDIGNGTFRIARHEPLKPFVEQWYISTVEELQDIFTHCGIKKTIDYGNSKA